MHYLGIDWATEKHDLCLLADDGSIVSQFSIPHTWKGFELLSRTLAHLKEFKVVIERSDGLLVDWMVQQGWVVHVLPPHVMASRRPRRTKDDKGDAYLLAYLLRLGDPECRPITRQSIVVEHLRQLAGAYDDALRAHRRLCNQLYYTLQQYYPTALNLFHPYSNLISLAFLEQYPTPQAAQALTLDELSAFLRSQKYCRIKHVDDLYSRLKLPVPLARVQDGHVATMLMLVPLIRALYRSKQALEKQMVTLFRQHPEANWWLKLPGTNGPLTPARILAWIGDDRSRFPTPEVLQATAGTAPVTRRSGKSHHVEFRQACSHPLRRAITDLARQSLRSSGWAQAYFQEQMERGHSHSRAIRALANRWLKIIWKLWQTGEVYDEGIHIANRAKRQQPRLVEPAA